LKELRGGNCSIYKEKRTQRQFKVPFEEAALPSWAKGSTAADNSAPQFLQHFRQYPSHP
jgi:hypothetical protein